MVRTGGSDERANLTNPPAGPVRPPSFGTTSCLSPAPERWSLQHPVTYGLIWVALLLVVFVPLSVRQFQRAALR